jgi:hypothetical protein
MGSISLHGHAAFAITVCGFAMHEVHEGTKSTKSTKYKKVFILVYFVSSCTSCDAEGMSRVIVQLSGDNR